MPDDKDTWNMTFYHRAIRTKIGDALRVHYDCEVTQPMPHRLFTLLLELNEQPEAEEMKAISLPRSSDRKQ
jgi:hypothetical protein